VQAAVDDVHLFTKDFAVKDITLDPLLIELLKLPDIKTFIKELCEKQDLKVIWILTESNHSITAACTSSRLSPQKDIIDLTSSIVTFTDGCFCFRLGRN
jgi:phosphopantetheine adenylyltransferase